VERGRIKAERVLNGDAARSSRSPIPKLRKPSFAGPRLRRQGDLFPAGSGRSIPGLLMMDAPTPIAGPKA